MMDVGNSLLSAVNGSDALKAAIGIKLLSKTQDIQAAQVSTLLQDFSVSNQAPHPYLGTRLDIRA
jgi:hypothetical protein